MSPACIHIAGNLCFNHNYAVGHIGLTCIMSLIILFSHFILNIFFLRLVFGWSADPNRISLTFR